MDTYDARWFVRVKNIYGNIPRYVRAVSLREVRAAFLQDPNTALHFEYPTCDSAAMQKRSALLQNILRELADEENITVREMYTDFIMEKLQRYDFLHEWSLFLANAQYSVPALQEKLDALYGVPDRALFGAKMSPVMTKLSAVPVTERDSQWQKLYALGSVVRDVVPTEELPREEQASDIISPESIPEYVAAYLQAKGYAEWKVVQSIRQRDRIRISAARKEFVLPSVAILQSRHLARPYTAARLQALLAHEVDTHIARAEHGARSPLALLGIGLAGYRAAEEGVALFREDALVPRGNASSDWYIAASIAYGVDSGVPRDIRETVSHMTAFYQYVCGEEKRVAQKRAFTLCSSIYLMPHAGGGVLRFAGRLHYEHGLRMIREFVQEHPERSVLFDIGKFNPANERHIAQLTALGIVSVQ